MVVEREREIEAFVPAGVLDHRHASRQAGRRRERRSPRGSPRCPDRRRPRSRAASSAEAVTSDLKQSAYAVREVRKKQQHRRPSPPFTTSTLQQEASRRFGFSAKRTMAVAQQLYEGLQIPGEGQVGLITYMRTDSLNIAQVARDEARGFITQRYRRRLRARPAARLQGEDEGRAGGARGDPADRSRSATRRACGSRSHPTSRSSTSSSGSGSSPARWRTPCSTRSSVDIDAKAPFTGAAVRPAARPRATCAFPASARSTSRDATREDEDEDAERSLPELTAADILRLLEVKPDQHFTEPPPRFTEATLVKALEENGIGRPSTYAPIMSTIQDRGYVKKDGRALKPQELGFIVCDMLIENFSDVFDTGLHGAHGGGVGRGRERRAPVAAGDPGLLRRRSSRTCEIAQDANREGRAGDGRGV